METKICPACGIARPLNEYYAFGAWSKKCRNCYVDQTAKYRAKNLDRIRERDRQRAKLPHRKAKAAENLKRWRSNNPDKVNKDRKDHPEKYKARTAVSNAIRNGRLAKGPCEVCGTTEKVQAHHHDYSRPLDVRWRCVKCHNDEHKQDWINRRKS